MSQIRGDQIQDGTVTSLDVQDGTITNADISANAAIDLAKINTPYKATVSSSSLLPTTGNTTGDIRLVTDINTLYFWDGSKWKQIALSGSVITGWTFFAPIIRDSTTSADITSTYFNVVVGRWRRVGSNLEAEIKFGRNATTMSSSNGIKMYVSDITSGISIDPTYTTNSINHMGHGMVYQTSTAGLIVSLLTSAGNNNSIRFSYDVSADLIQSQFPAYGGLDLYLSIPIAQWTSNINLVTDSKEYACNTQSTINTNDSSTFGYSISGTPILANTALTYYDIQFKNDIQPGDDIKLQFQSNLSKAWINYNDILFPINGNLAYPCGIAFYGVGAYGVGYIQLTSKKMRVYFYSNVNTWSGIGTTSWATFINDATYGFSRWRIIKVSGSNLAEVPATVTATYYNSNMSVGGAIWNFSAIVEDTHTAVTTGSAWKFTAPIDGLYLVQLVTSLVSGTGNTASLYKNGANYQPLTVFTTAGWYYNASATLRLYKGEYINILGGASDTVVSGRITITRIGP